MENPKLDILDQALLDYHLGANQKKLMIHNKYGKPDPMPVEVYFREINSMPDIEIFALTLCSGEILDVGAGVGSHALHFQETGHAVTALELSPTKCSIMKSRGVESVLEQDFFHVNRSKVFDTLLFLMNTIGLTGTLDGLHILLTRARELLAAGGSVIFDSCDVSYVWDQDRLNKSPYYGEIDYKYQYGNRWGDWFKWLYVDQETMRIVCKDNGWSFQVLFEDDSSHYLGRLILL